MRVCQFRHGRNYGLALASVRLRGAEYRHLRIFVEAGGHWSLKRPVRAGKADAGREGANTFRHGFTLNPQASSLTPPHPPLALWPRLARGVNLLRLPPVPLPISWNRLPMSVKVCKFGGSSLADAGQIGKVRRILEADAQRRYLVPSAPRQAPRRRPQDHRPALPLP